MAYAIENTEGISTITADGANEKDAFTDAARGLFASLYDFENVRGHDQRVKLAVEAKSMEDLLSVWLSELLERQTIHGITYSNFYIVSIQKIKNTQYLLTASALGEATDSSSLKARADVSVRQKSIACGKKQKKYVCKFQIQRGR